MASLKGSEEAEYDNSTIQPDQNTTSLHSLSEIQELNLETKLNILSPAETAILQIQSALSKYDTSRSLLKKIRTFPLATTNNHRDPSSIELPAGVGGETYVLGVIRDILKSFDPEPSSIVWNDNAEGVIPIHPIDAANENQWQVTTRMPGGERTHPSDLVPYSHHVRDLEAFKKDFMKAKQCADALESRYIRVEALIITWEESDLLGPIGQETDKLRTLFHELGYNVTEYAIPSIDAQNELQWEVLGFLKKRKYRDDPSGETLFIIFYSGHGSARNDASFWHPTRDAASPREGSLRPKGPTVQWNDILKNFDMIHNQDVLFILDCCYAGAAVLHKGPAAKKEVLAACGSEDQTLAGDGSFTVRLVDAFRDLLKRKPVFQVASLYGSLISSSQSPVCIHKKLNDEIPGGICLFSLKQPRISERNKPKAPKILSISVPDASNKTTRPHSSSSAVSTQDTTVFSHQDATGQSHSGIGTSTSGSGEPENFQYRVLLSVKLQENLIPQGGKDWCLKFPSTQAELEDVRFELIFPTHSTLIFLTMPVRYWVHLKDNPAYTFIDFVQNTGSFHFHPEDSTLASMPNVNSTNLATAEIEKTPQDMGKNDLVNYLLCSMRGFFDKVHTDNKEKRHNFLVRRFRKVAVDLGVPSPIQSDPRYDLVEYIAHHLRIDRNDNGEFTTVSYDLSFDLLVKDIFENGRRSVNEALGKVNGTAYELESTINAQIDQLKDKVVSLNRMQTEKMAMQNWKASTTSFEREKRSSIRTFARSKSGFAKQARSSFSHHDKNDQTAMPHSTVHKAAPKQNNVNSNTSESVSSTSPRQEPHMRYSKLL